MFDLDFDLNSAQSWVKKVCESTTQIFTNEWNVIWTWLVGNAGKKSSVDVISNLIQTLCSDVMMMHLNLMLKTLPRLYRQIVNFKLKELSMNCKIYFHKDGFKIDKQGHVEIRKLTPTDLTLYKNILIF